MEYTFETRLYSKLREGLTSEILDLVNESSAFFGIQDEIVSRRGNWRKRLDKVCCGENKSSKRDTLIGYADGIAIASVQFSICETEREAYSEGVYVCSNLRHNGVGVRIIESLMPVLWKNLADKFYVGYPDKNERSDFIRRSLCAQRFARCVINRFGEATLEVSRTPKGFIRGYVVDVARADEMLVQISQ